MVTVPKHKKRAVANRPRDNRNKDVSPGIVIKSAVMTVSQKELLTNGHTNEPITINQLVSRTNTVIRFTRVSRQVRF